MITGKKLLDINETYSLDIVNDIKRDHNDMENSVGVDLIKLIEEGLVAVVGYVDGKLVYEATQFGKEQVIQAEA